MDAAIFHALPPDAPQLGAVAARIAAMQRSSKPLGAFGHPLGQRNADSRRYASTGSSLSWYSLLVTLRQPFHFV
jgi:hypothetical protein